jgi:hypothetical protein
MVGKSGIRCYKGSEERPLICLEALCLDWAVILLDLTYGFITDFESKHSEFPGVLPHLHFVEVAIAERQDPEKYFPIEEWINTSKTSFVKYINNGLPVPCVPCNASAEVKNTADFLCFA